MDNKKEYCSGMDNERYDGAKFYSIEESAKERAEDLDIGDDFYVGEVRELEMRELVSVDNLIETIQERAYEECGDVAEDYLVGEKFQELEDLIIDWFKKKDLEPGFYVVENEKHYEVTGHGTYEEIPNGQARL